MGFGFALAFAFGALTSAAPAGFVSSAFVAPLPRRPRRRRRFCAPSDAVASGSASSRWVAADSLTGASSSAPTSRVAAGAGAVPEPPPLPRPRPPRRRRGRAEVVVAASADSEVVASASSVAAAEVAGRSVLAGFVAPPRPRPPRLRRVEVLGASAASVDPLVDAGGGAGWAVVAALDLGLGAGFGAATDPSVAFDVDPEAFGLGVGAPRLNAATRSSVSWFILGLLPSLGARGRVAGREMGRNVIGTGDAVHP
jgi:hypothetical protein